VKERRIFGRETLRKRVFDKQRTPRVTARVNGKRKSSKEIKGDRVVE